MVSLASELKLGTVPAFKKREKHEKVTPKIERKLKAWSETANAARAG